MAMNQDFVDLVDQLLADNQITDGEMEVLLKKAEKLGIDRDEAYYYAKAEEQKRQQGVVIANMKKLGKVCPHCGKQVQDLANVCPHCDSPITAEISAELNEILENLEDALVDLKAGRNSADSRAQVERYVRKAKRSFGNNPKVIDLLEEIEAEGKIAEQNRELNDIIDNLEEALVSFKSGDNVAEAKALVERYARTARSKYGDNSKVAALLADIEKEKKNAEAKATRKAIFNFIGKNWKWLVPVAFVLVIIIISAIPTAADVKNDPAECIKAINEAIASGDIAKAEEYVATYENWKGDIESGINAVANAYIDNGELDKAATFINSTSWINNQTKVKLLDKFIEAGRYDDAESSGHFGYGDASEYYDFLCKCIDHMQDNGNTRIKAFIDRKIAKFDDITYSDDTYWQQNSVKSRLYQYAGVR